MYIFKHTDIKTFRCCRPTKCTYKYEGSVQLTTRTHCASKQHASMSQFDAIDWCTFSQPGLGPRTDVEMRLRIGTSFFVMAVGRGEGTRRRHFGEIPRIMTQTHMGYMFKDIKKTLEKTFHEVTADEDTAGDADKKQLESAVTDAFHLACQKVNDECRRDTQAAADVEKAYPAMSLTVMVVNTELGCFATFQLGNCFALLMDAESGSVIWKTQQTGSTWSPEIVPQTECKPIVSSAYFPKVKFPSVFMGSKGFFEKDAFGANPEERIADMLKCCTPWVLGTEDLLKGTEVQHLLDYCPQQAKAKENNVNFIQKVRSHSCKIAKAISQDPARAAAWECAIQDAYTQVVKTGVLEAGCKMTLMENAYLSVVNVALIARLLLSKLHITCALARFRLVDE